MKIHPTVAIITRMAFDKPLTDVQWHQFTNVYLPSLAAQKDKRFVVYLLVDKVRNFRGSAENRKRIEEAVAAYPFVRVEDPVKHFYQVEVRLDYDDQVSDDFVESIKMIVEANFRRTEPYLLSYQPMRVWKGNHFRYHRTYDKKCTSMCLALVQNEKKDNWVYQRPHNLMPQEVPDVVVIGAGHYFWHDHGENLSKR